MQCKEKKNALSLIVNKSEKKLRICPKSQEALLHLSSVQIHQVVFFFIPPTVQETTQDVPVFRVRQQWWGGRRAGVIQPLPRTERRGCVSGHLGTSPAYSWLRAAAHVSLPLCFDRTHDWMWSKKIWLQRSRLHRAHLKIATGVPWKQRGGELSVRLCAPLAQFCDCERVSVSMWLLGLCQRV